MTSPQYEGDDRSLVALAIGGDERAFAELMRRHKEKLYRFVRAYVGDAHEAFDLTQEAFVAAWSALRSYDRNRSFEIWLRRIALNKCRDWSRRRAVRHFFFSASSLDDREADPPAPVATTEHASLEQRLDALEAAIATLPDGLKTPLVLTLLQGMSHKEAAAVMRISPKAIETRVYRARNLLAEALKLPPEEED